MWPLKKKDETADLIKKEVSNAVQQMRGNSLTPQEMRQRLASAISGGYDYSDSLHNVFLDFGYPSTIQFSQFWNMYRRFGIAQNVVELPVDTGWKSAPTVEGAEQFSSDLEKLIKNVSLWNRLKALDTRQRIGRYAGMFVRVRDDKSPDQPIEGTLAGVASIMQMVPLNEGQLTVNEIDNDPNSDNFGLPTMYRFNGGAAGNRSEKNAASFNIHPDRIIIASEEADNGGIYGYSALEASFNSLMDLRKIIGAGGEGFYRNASQSVAFKLQEGAPGKLNPDLLEKFNDQADDFLRNRMRRSLFTPGLDAEALESSLTNPKEFFMNALNDVAAASKIPATILIGQQTGRLASGEDSRHFLSMVNSRRENFMTQMIVDTIDWCIEHGALPSSEYEVVWDDLLAVSDKEKLGNAESMSKINKDQFASGGEIPFSGDEIREAAGFEVDEEIEPEGEELPEEDDD